MNPLSHVAIIMDGNGRWAKKNNSPRKTGHLQGSKNIKNIAEFCIKKKILYLTLFAFSFDNWKRPASEIDYLFYLFENFIKQNLDVLLKKNIKINFIGEKIKISSKIKKLINEVEMVSKDKNGLFLTIALNYSSKHEITNSVNKLLLEKKNKKISILDIENNLYTSNIPNPDLLIRTGGYSRLSNFLLWQISYTELFFVKKFWPDFNSKDLNLIIKKYKMIKRNFGKV